MGLSSSSSSSESDAEPNVVGKSLSTPSENGQQINRTKTGRAHQSCLEQDSTIKTHRHQLFLASVLSLDPICVWTVVNQSPERLRDVKSRNTTTTTNIRYSPLRFRLDVVVSSVLCSASTLSDRQRSDHPDSDTACPCGFSDFFS